MALARLVRRLDLYLVLLVTMVAIAAILPARGAGKLVLDQAVFGAVALLFFLYGARLSPAAVWAGITHWRLQALVLATTFIVFPVLGIGAAMLLRPHLDTSLVTGLIFLSVLPSTVQSSIAFTSIARGNVSAALCSASVSNLLGIVITPLLVSLLLQSKGVGMSPAALEDIALQLFLPFLLGQIARPFIGNWLLRHKRLTQFVDRGSILLVVYAAFSAGMVAGIWSQITPLSLLLVVAIDAVLLAIVILFTTAASRALGFSTEDEISIVFCGSKKSMASGIPMANILFPGHALGLIVLPLMLFHQIQLFVCATLARRYARRPADVAERVAVATA